MSAIEMIEPSDSFELEVAKGKPSNVVQLPTAQTPAAIMALAIQQGSPVEVIERMWALQVAYEKREAEKAFNVAMSDFKTKPLTIMKRKQVGYETKDGDFVGYSHAELSDVTEVVGPAMAEFGLSHRWNIRQAEGRVHVSCIVTHRDGHAETVTMDAAPDTSGKKNAIQAIASATTYMMRYTLLAATGMSTKGMDDDGAGSGSADDEARRRQWIDDQKANISEARNGGELKKIMAYALGKVRENNDPEAEKELLDHATNKVAAAAPAASKE